MSWRRATPDSNWFAGVVHRPCLECELLAPAAVVARHSRIVSTGARSRQPNPVIPAQAGKPSQFRIR